MAVSSASKAHQPETPMSDDRRAVRDPDRTRLLLLQAACEEFAEKGIAGARVDVIARRAGINKQALYYHFGSKNNLFREALEDRFRRFRERERDLNVDAKPPEEALATLIGATFDDLRDSPDLVGMIIDENRQKGIHLDHARMRAINRPLLDAIQAVLARGEQDGVFRAGIDAEQFYFSMMSLVGFTFSHRYTLSAVVGRDLGSEDAIGQRRAHIIDLLLAAARRGDQNGGSPAAAE